MGCKMEGEGNRSDPRHERDEKREKEAARGSWEGREKGEKAWCNGGTSLRVSAPHQRVELHPVDGRTMPPAKEGR